MKITKSELKEMIREALREELATSHKSGMRKLKESQDVCYMCKKPCGGDNDLLTLFGPVHNDCWDAFCGTDEWYADAYYEYAVGQSYCESLEEFDQTYGINYSTQCWKKLRGAGKLPISDAECGEIERKATDMFESNSKVDVYVTYDRYEHNEWFAIYNIDTDEQRAIDHCKNEDLFNFIRFGPDDCHHFQLQRVSMTKAEYDNLIKLYKSYGDEEISDGELFDIIAEIYENYEEDDIIIASGGIDDLYDIVEYYGKEYGVDVSEDDSFYNVQAELFADEELFNEVLRAYINDTY